jgi:hypothetical protein
VSRINAWCLHDEPRSYRVERLRIDVNTGAAVARRSSVLRWRLRNSFVTLTQSNGMPDAIKQA